MMNKIAIRTLHNALSRSPRLAMQLLAQDADAGFDGGEFSAPYHACAFERIVDDITTRVAKAFDVDAVELANAHTAWMNDGLIAEMQRASVRVAIEQNTYWDRIDRDRDQA